MHRRFGIAVATSLLLHALLLVLPHPALWSTVATMKREPASHNAISIRFAVREVPDHTVRTVASAQSAPAVSQVRPEEASLAGTIGNPGEFHLSRELTRQPELVGSLAETSWSPYNISGEALFRLVIDSQGAARHVSVLRSTLPRDLEGDAAHRLYTAQYRPGEIDGRPVNAEMFIEMRLETVPGDAATRP